MFENILEARREKLRETVEDTINAMRPGRGWRHGNVTANNPKEADYIAHVASAVCTSEFKARTDGRITVTLIAR